jgi:hypothetical protein
VGKFNFVPQFFMVKVFRLKVPLMELYIAVALYAHRMTEIHASNVDGQPVMCSSQCQSPPWKWNCNQSRYPVIIRCSICQCSMIWNPASHALTQIRSERLQSVHYLSEHELWTSWTLDSSIIHVSWLYQSSSICILLRSPKSDVLHCPLAMIALLC